MGTEYNIDHEAVKTDIYKIVFCNNSHAELTASASASNHVADYYPGFVPVVVLLNVLVAILRTCVLPCLLLTLSKILWDTYNISSRDHLSSLPLPPGGFGLPFVGETLSLIFKGRSFFDERREKYGNIYRTHILGKPTIRVIGETRVKQIMSGENAWVTAQWPTSAQKLLGVGSLSSSSGMMHSIRKKTILRAFSNEALVSYTPVIHEVVRNHIKKWCNSTSIFGYEEFKKLTFEISCRVLLGIEMDTAEKGKLLNNFDTLLRNLFSLPVCVPGTGLYKGMKSRELLLNKIEECLKRKQNIGSPHNFMDALSLMAEIKGDGELSMEEVKDVGLEMLFAGHETTASAACSLALNLHNHPEVLLNICKELASHGVAESVDCFVSMETLHKLKYTKNVVKEVLRIAPPIGAGFRKVLQTFEIEGYQIPKDWTVVYSIRDSHECTDAVVKPEQFNPDRWSHTGNDDKHFLAFGGGKRACAGKEFAQLVLRILAIELARSCSWRVLNPNPVMKTLPVPHPTDNLPMEFLSLFEFRQRASTV